ncbi:MAG TPA: tetratricopeptide repeat protein [Longimicrobiales bacterium]
MRRRQTRARQAVEMSAAVGSAQGEAAAPEDDVDGAERRTATAAVAAPSTDAADESAVEHWRDQVLREPSNVMARRRLARVFELRGEPLLAMEHLEAARSIQPDNVELIVELANSLIGLRRFDPAERELRRALKLQPDNAHVHLGLGVISFRRGLYAQAEQELRRALELEGGSADAYFYRGEALNQLSRVDEAIDMLLRATQLDPGNARAYYMMGILYDKKGRPQEAAAMYRKAREVGAA